MIKAHCPNIGLWIRIGNLSNLGQMNLGRPVRRKGGLKEYVLYSTSVQIFRVQLN